MAGRETLVLSHGGFKSLVALATLAPSVRPAVLFARDGRGSDARAEQACKAQCEHYGSGPIETLTLDHLGRGDGGAVVVASLAALELLTAGAQRAVRHGATHLVWAARAGEDFEKLSRATEAMVLLEHFAGAGGQASLSIETPLLEMRGEEVVEVGERLGVPWRLSRDCWQDQDQPCGQCPGCVERRAAFGAAEVADPLTEPEAKA